MVFRQASKASIRKRIRHVRNAIKIKNEHRGTPEKRINLAESESIAEVTVGQERAEMLAHYNFRHRKILPTSSGGCNPNFIRARLSISK